MRFRTCAATAVAVVRRQKEIGIDVPGDGEFGKAMAYSVNYGAWWNYSFTASIRPDPDRTSMLDAPPSKEGQSGIKLTNFHQPPRPPGNSPALYNDPESGIYMGPDRLAASICTRSDQLCRPPARSNAMLPT